MSDQTDEERRLRAIVYRAVKKAWMLGIEPTVVEVTASIMATWNKSEPIHPDVPVMYHSGWSDQDVVCTADYFEDGQTHVSNIRVLILEETTREIARRAITRYCTSRESLNDAMKEVDRDIADYRINGPGDSHE